MSVTLREEQRVRIVLFHVLQWYKTSLTNVPDTAIFIRGIWSLPQPPLQQMSRVCALPWARQRTTSRHSACARAGSPPRGPCTRSSRRTSKLSCRGRWLLCSDQNLHKLKQNRAHQISKNYYLCFCWLKLFEQNKPTSWWSALLSLCRKRPQAPGRWSPA